MASPYTVSKWYRGMLFLYLQGIPMILQIRPCREISWSRILALKPDILQGNSDTLQHAFSSRALSRQQIRFLSILHLIFCRQHPVYLTVAEVLTAKDFPLQLKKIGVPEGQLYLTILYKSCAEYTSLPIISTIEGTKHRALLFGFGFSRDFILFLHVQRSPDRDPSSAQSSEYHTVYVLHRTMRSLKCKAADFLPYAYGLRWHRKPGIFYRVRALSHPPFSSCGRISVEQKRSFRRF